MSCAAVAAVAVLWLAAAPPPVSAGISPPPPPPAVSVAKEPLFADIVARAGALKAAVEAFKAGPPTPAFKQAIGELAALDMQGHFALAKRGTDGDLKCILKGIAEDLPLKLKALEDAATDKARAQAVQDMGYLLNDNVEVITSPPEGQV